ncbi:holo-ACP synthase [Arcobacter porcinus]|uniref:Holo-[acyl-carrier-protein] synthase n=1 Tax=Arcobacter porcinus TaxID=1935204 RepID=A0A1C0AWV9_9BACT|nr:holo-ACP synthase [Arcobacter porcinus]OCL97126.1 Holo-[acyl-carrier-protein] synthase [Aliarcobacter thereius]OCL84036.1 Holo-[acyl-carrier-protein] synthase [Arcobacter porcinus]OCL84558.1 Holo-[acyl-carrier-protein] synthase [Arcobacter porcinus]OCL89100.1 Holo-[acyl-carrier-protein] synthase [Arcobacter porcinus]OCL91520.1 Holo-[acyl-carrier-protein] synthase [Arcobacter porcinus]
MIGIDIVNIDRVKKLKEKFEDKFYDRFLSSSEKLLIQRVETAAGFWAAKEAASKAIGTGIGEICSFQDIKIKKDKNNAPKIKYSKALRKRFNIKKSYLSITHDGGFAIAVVVNIFK